MRKRTFQISLMMLIVVLLSMTALTGCDQQQKSSDGSSETTISGTWQTVSTGYEYYGTLQSEYYVRFTNSEIIYGHMKNGEFVPDYSDRIIRLEEFSPGEFIVQAESSNGIQYTYRTSESSHNTLEYYGTWSEEHYPETYSISASLGRCSE